jgi:hypothetical protein
MHEKLVKLFVGIQVPPFWQGKLAHWFTFYLIYNTFLKLSFFWIADWLRYLQFSQLFPKAKLGHWQLKVLLLKLWHEPPFWQGKFKHKSVIWAEAYAFRLE